MTEPRGGEMHVYDLCVVGAGLVGSAIAGHASKKPGVKVCLVGPEEPKERVCRNDREIFGAHYDSGRIASANGGNPIWAKLAVRAIAEYRDIERESGVAFFHNVGVMSAGTRGFHERECEEFPTNGRRVDNRELRERHGYIKFGDNEDGLYYHNSGWIDPRKAILAHMCIALNHGCDIIRDVVDHVIKDSQSTGDCLMRVLTARGTVILARQVVLATNTFTTSRNLLPGNTQPKFQASPQTVVLAEVAGEDLYKLRNMPCYLYGGSGGDGWHTAYPRNPNGMIHFYMLPPVLYPDGKYYVKIGHSDGMLKSYLDKGEISRWHCTEGDPWIVENLRALLTSMFQGIEFKSFYSDSCVTMVTATGLPYIARVHEGLGMAIGGNGHGAKTANEVGRIAAEMMLCPDAKHEIPLENFRLVTEDSGSNPTSKL